MDDLREHLRCCDIASEIYYPLTLHQQECFQNLPDRPCPVSEQLAGECLSIPIYPELTTEQQDEVVFSIADFLKSLGINLFSQFVTDTERTFRRDVGTLQLAPLLRRFWHYQYRQYLLGFMSQEILVCSVSTLLLLEHLVHYLYCVMT